MVILTKEISLAIIKSYTKKLIKPGSMDFKDLLELDGLNETAMKESRIMKEFCDELVAITKNLVNKYYPDEIHRLSADGYRDLDDKIYREVDGLVKKISNIIYREKE